MSTLSDCDILLTIWTEGAMIRPWSLNWDDVTDASPPSLQMLCMSIAGVLRALPALTETDPETLDCVHSPSSLQEMLADHQMSMSPTYWSAAQQTRLLHWLTKWSVRSSEGGPDYSPSSAYMMTTSTSSTPVRTPTDRAGVGCSTFDTRRAYEARGRIADKSDDDWVNVLHYFSIGPRKLLHLQVGFFNRIQG
jgi:hypothetical protein